jgi:hypothetical protein
MLGAVAATGIALLALRPAQAPRRRRGRRSPPSAGRRDVLSA